MGNGVIVIMVLTLGLISFTASEALAIPPPSPPLVGDFKCYELFSGPSFSIEVKLDDQFEIENYTVDFPRQLCTSVLKFNSTTGAPLSDPPVHVNQTYVVYDMFKTIFSPDDFGNVTLTDQFGSFEAEVFSAFNLWVPANKTHLGQFDKTQDFHWKCYNIENTTNVTFPSSLNLTDQFDNRTHFIASPLLQLCTPVEKTPPSGPTFGNSFIPDHMICYDIDAPFPSTFDTSPITTEDQFIAASQGLVFESKLCTVASKVIISGLVGGESLPIKPVSLLVAGVYTNSVWLLPIVAVGAVVGIVIFKLKRK